MPSNKVDWVVVENINKVEIGAIGFIGNKAAIVAAFYDDRDGNYDGKVGATERIVSALSPISLNGRAVTEVAMSARTDMDIIMRDASFAQEAGRLYASFAAGLVADGIYAAYFSRAVSQLIAPIARRATSGVIKQFVIRQGMERAVKAAYDSAMP